MSGNLYDADWTPEDEANSQLQADNPTHIDALLQPVFLQTHQEMKRRGEVIKALERGMGVLRHKYMLLRDDEEGVTEESTLQQMMQESDELREVNAKLVGIIQELRLQTIGDDVGDRLEKLENSLMTLEGNALTTTRTSNGALTGQGYRVVMQQNSGSPMEPVDLPEFAALLKQEGKY